MARNTVALGGSTVNFLVDLSIMLYLAFFLVRDGKQLRVLLIGPCPLATTARDLLFAKFAEVLRASVKAACWWPWPRARWAVSSSGLLGIKARGALGVVMTLLSLIPWWRPAWSGRRWPGTCCSRAIMCPAWDAGLRGLRHRSGGQHPPPVLVGRDTKLPDFMVLLSTLGGFSLFGMDGFVTGPMLAVLFVTVWKIFIGRIQTAPDTGRQRPRTGCGRGRPSA